MRSSRNRSRSGDVSPHFFFPKKMHKFTKKKFNWSLQARHATKNEAIYGSIPRWCTITDIKTMKMMKKNCWRWEENWRRWQERTSLQVIQTSITFFEDNKTHSLSLKSGRDLCTETTSLTYWLKAFSCQPFLNFFNSIPSKDFSVIVTAEPDSPVREGGGGNKVFLRDGLTYKCDGKEMFREKYNYKCFSRTDVMYST